MELLDFVNNFWYLIVGAIILVFLLYKQSKNETVAGLNKNKFKLLTMSIIFGLIIITMQDNFFHDHAFFILGFIIFIPFISGLIWLMFNKSNKYVIEARIQGQEFFQLGKIPENSNTKRDLTKIITTETGLRIHIMDSEYFANLKHYGDDFSPRYNAGDNIKKCDYFDGETLYHPEHPDTENVSFWTQITKFNAWRKLVPDMIRKIIELTDMHETKMLMEIESMNATLPHRLTGFANQIKPYSLVDEIKKYMETHIAELHKSLTDSEKTNKENDPEKEAQK